MKTFLKSLLARTPYRVVRNRGLNRFDATEASLIGMRDRGFRPTLIIDAGAHLGSFSLMAKTIFPTAELHLIEPQRACMPALRALCAANGFKLHEYALTDREGDIPFKDIGAPTTGAHINPSKPCETTKVKATTLDALYGASIAGSDQPLLKIDIEGAELLALAGAHTVLKYIDAILLEVRFFSPARSAATIADLTAHLSDNGFDLYEIASLAGRRRDGRLSGGDFLFIRRGSILESDNAWH